MDAIIDTPQPSQALGTTDEQTHTAEQPDGRQAYRLADFLPGGSASATPVVALDSGSEVVVLSRLTDQTVEVCANRLLVAATATEPAEPVRDPQRQIELLREALAAMAVSRAASQQEEQRCRQLADMRRAESESQQAAHAQVLDEIRSYAIDRHREGEFCQYGLNQFLERFHLPLYDPKVRISYTVSGSYEVDGSEPDSAREDGRRYIGVELDEVDNVVDGSNSYTVTVTNAEPIG